MGLVGKLKNILFEEEEVEIPVIEKKEKKVVQAPRETKVEYKEMPKKEVAQTSNYYNDLEPVIKQETQMEEKNHYQELVSEREIFKSEKTFNFPAFDEEEFESVVPRKRASSVNVMEHEAKQKATKKAEYKKPERKEEEKVVKAKFRPSPIISPVYGILDKNYTPEEITTRSEVVESKTLDVDSVRRKAFGTLEEKKPLEEEEIQKVDDKILEERLEKARTIDELLKDSSDEVITVQNEDIEKVNEKYEDIDSFEKIDTKKEIQEEDSLENDLFDLIDSMYENREEGE